jgi:hypothetical protein
MPHFPKEERRLRRERKIKEEEGRSGRERRRQGGVE